MKRPAFPIHAFVEEDEDFSGLSKREYFAAAAMQGLLAGDTDFVRSEASIASLAVTQADALIRELNK